MNAASVAGAKTNSGPGTDRTAYVREMAQLVVYQ